MTPLHRLRSEGRDDAERQEVQNAVNPKFVPRQHLLQYAVEGAEAGDPSELEALMKVGKRELGRRRSLGAWEEGKGGRGYIEGEGV